MIWQRVCLAIGLAVGGAVLSHGALAQTSDPANDAGAVAAPTGEPAPTAQKADRSEPAPAGNGGPKVIVDVDLTAQSERWIAAIESASSCLPQAKS